MQTPEHPPLISNALLIELSNPTADQQRGEYTPETRALLAAALPEICAELLHRRSMQANSGSVSDRFATRSVLITARLRHANDVLATPGPIEPGILRRACETIIRHSDNWQARVAAADCLHEMRHPIPGTATQGAAQWGDSPPPADVSPADVSTSTRARLQQAEARLASKHAHDPETLRADCTVILRHSPDWRARTAAADALFEMRTGVTVSARPGPLASSAKGRRDQ